MIYAGFGHPWPTILTFLRSIPHNQPPAASTRGHYAAQWRRANERRMARKHVTLGKRLGNTGALT